MGRSRESVQAMTKCRIACYPVTGIGIPLIPGPMRAWDKTPRDMYIVIKH